MMSIARAYPFGFASRNSMQKVADPAPMSTANFLRSSIRCRLEELEGAVAVKRLAWGKGKTSVWRARFRGTTHCGSPVVTRVLARCSIDDAANISTAAASTDYAIILDGIRFDNMSNVNPLYGLVSYSIVNSAGVPMIMNENSDNMVEYRFALAVG